MSDYDAIDGRVSLQGYSDADYAGDHKDCKSVSGGVLCMYGMIVGWICKKQTSVALSTIEAECNAASLVASELLERMDEVFIKRKWKFQ